MMNDKSNLKLNYIYGMVFLGVICGSLFILFSYLSSKYIFMNNCIEEYRINPLMNQDIFPFTIYILRRRVGQIFLFLVVMFLCSYSIATIIYNYSFGFYFGLIITDLFIKFGINGIVYTIICFFPHYIFYFFLILFLVKWFHIRKNDFYNYNRNQLQYFVKIFVILLMFFMAFFWEVKFQKNFLIYFYQYLV